MKIGLHKKVKIGQHKKVKIGHKKVKIGLSKFEWEIVKHLEKKAFGKKDNNKILKEYVTTKQTFFTVIFNRVEKKY